MAAMTMGNTQPLHLRKATSEPSNRRDLADAGHSNTLRNATVRHARPHLAKVPFWKVGGDPGRLTVCRLGTGNDFNPPLTRTADWSVR